MILGADRPFYSPSVFFLLLKDAIQKHVQFFLNPNFGNKYVIRSKVYLLLIKGGAINFFRNSCHKNAWSTLFANKS